jgi:glycosyltransferase involved in cell wall biosynthesis
MISASMIVKNEEAMLGACLASINKLDEIVILDTGSTDKTVEIAKKYTSKVYADEYKWSDNFAEARNLSLSKCHGDWIFIIDADEKLISPVDQLYEDVNKHSDEHIININVNGNKTSMLAPRLFKNNTGIVWKGAIHNYLSVTGNAVGKSVIEYGYSPTHKKDPDRTIRILRKELEKNPKLVRERYYLAREHYYRKNWTAAIAWFDSYLSVAWWAPEWADAWVLKAICHKNTGEFSKAKDCCLEAIKINADFKQALKLMAELSGPKNKKKWLDYAKMSNNNDVLFIRA